MTPAELITRKLKAKLEALSVALPIQSLLIEALDGEKHAEKSSAVLLNVHLMNQLEEPLPHYAFNVEAKLHVAIDDDRSGLTFRENYDAIWAAFDFLARSDNCETLGDENDEVTAHVFAVDGFLLGQGDDPDFQEDENGGSWTVSFKATLTGRAN